MFVCLFFIVFFLFFCFRFFILFFLCFYIFFVLFVSEKPAFHTVMWPGFDSQFTHVKLTPSDNSMCCILSRPLVGPRPIPHAAQRDMNWARSRDLTSNLSISLMVKSGSICFCHIPVWGWKIRTQNGWQGGFMCYQPRRKFSPPREVSYGVMGICPTEAFTPKLVRGPARPIFSRNFHWKVVMGTPADRSCQVPEGLARFLAQK